VTIDVVPSQDAVQLRLVAELESSDVSGADRAQERLGLGARQRDVVGLEVQAEDESRVEAGTQRRQHGQQIRP